MRNSTIESLVRVVGNSNKTRLHRASATPLLLASLWFALLVAPEARAKDTVDRHDEATDSATPAGAIGSRGLDRFGEPYLRFGVDISNAARPFPFATIGVGFQAPRLGVRAEFGQLIVAARLSASLTWALDTRRRHHLVLTGGREGAGLQEYDYRYGFVGLGIEKRYRRWFTQLAVVTGTLERSDIRDSSAPNGRDDTEDRTAVVLSFGIVLWRP